MKSLLNEKMHLDIHVYEQNVFEIIDYLKDYILKNECSCLSVDISKLNLIDASKVSILCSTFHFSKYPEGKVLWLVKDNETLRTIKLLKLKNISIEIKQCNKSSNRSNCYIGKTNLAKV